MGIKFLICECESLQPALGSLHWLSPHNSGTSCLSVTFFTQTSKASTSVQKSLHAYMVLVAVSEMQLSGKWRILAHTCFAASGHGGHQREAPSSRCRLTAEGRAVFYRNRSSSQGYHFKSSAKAGLRAPVLLSPTHKFWWARLFSLLLQLIWIKFTLSPSTEILNERQKWKYFIFNGEQREREFQLFSLTKRGVISSAEKTAGGSLIYGLNYECNPHNRMRH